MTSIVMNKKYRKYRFKVLQFTNFTESEESKPADFCLLSPYYCSPAIYC